MIKILIY